MDGEEEVIDVVDDELVDDDEVVEVPTEEPPAEEKPFLKVNDRTTYRTPEEAIKGFQNANERLSQYRELGSPEEIREMRARMAELDRITGRDKGTSENMDDPLAGLDDDQKAQWQAYWKRNEKQLKAAGYVHESELPDRVEMLVDTRERRRDARSEFARLATERGMEVDDELIQLLETTAGEWIGAGKPAKLLTPRQKELNAIYFSTGGPQKFAQQLFERVYGKAPAKPKAAESEPKPDPRQRAANGQFEAAKRRTQDLPKTPTSRTPGIQQPADDDLSKIADPRLRSRVRAQRRLQEAREMAAEMRAS